MKTAGHSNTIRLGAVQVLTGLVGYLGGQMDEAAAGAVIFMGLVQIGQRLWSLRKEAAAATPAAGRSGG